MKSTCCIVTNIKDYIQSSLIVSHNKKKRKLISLSILNSVSKLYEDKNVIDSFENFLIDHYKVKDNNIYGKKIN